MRQSVKIVLRYLVVGLWASLTGALIFWWYIFGRAQLERLEGLGLEPESSVLAHERMLFWEGGALIVLVLLGGLALGYQVFREIQLARKIQLFFLTFAHELKTPLASLRLQAEGLKESLQDSSQQSLAQRMINDTVRLNLQLENSLFFAQLQQSGLLMEDLNLSELVESLCTEWPDLQFVQKGQAQLRADRNAMQVMLRNLVQNALVHGGATQITLEVLQGAKEGSLKLKFTDNGQGFSGNAKNLGVAFFRHGAKSGNGLGLYLVRELARRMAGHAQVLPVKSGFSVELELMGIVL